MTGATQTNTKRLLEGLEHQIKVDVRLQTLVKNTQEDGIHEAEGISEKANQQPQNNHLRQLPENNILKPGRHKDGDELELGEVESRDEQAKHDEEVVKDTTRQTIQATQKAANRHLGDELPQVLQQLVHDLLCTVLNVQCPTAPCPSPSEP